MLDKVTGNEISYIYKDRNNDEVIKKQDKLICIAIMSVFAVLTIQYFVLYFFSLTESSIGSQMQLLSKAIVGFFFLISLKIVLKRNLFVFVNVYILGIIVFLFNYLFFPRNSEALMSIAFSLFFTCLPCFVYSLSIRDKNIFIDIMHKVSIIVFLFGVLIGFLAITNKVSIGTYSMSLSYYILLPAITSLYRFFVKKSIGLILVFTISFLTILALGARGPIMCLSVYIIFAFIKNIKKFTYKSLLLITSTFFAVTLAIIYFNNIITFINNIFLSLGIHSRTLSLLLRDGLHLSGRDKLYDVIIQQIVENPLMGIGIAGDRVIIGGYTHNIFLEILSGFGVILGSIIIVVIVLICYKAMANKNKLNSNINIIWFCLGVVPLLVSSSYLTDFRFWIFIGFALSSITINYSGEKKHEYSSKNI